MRKHSLLKASRPYFKLIGGANFTAYEDLRDLACVYAQAGCDLIDVAATPEAVLAAVAGLQDAFAEGAQEYPLVMVSVTAADDPHCLQAVQDPERCTHLCPQCRNACPHGAISETLEILADRCVGCTLCLSVCPYEALQLVARPFTPSLEQLWALGARGLELHTGSGSRAELNSWRESCIAWVAKGGLFSASLNAAQLDRESAITLARELVSWFPEDRIILQADGKPISGHAHAASTRPALDFAQALLQAELGAAIQPAGGANHWTGPMAASLKMPLAGIGIGSFARCIISSEAGRRENAGQQGSAAAKDWRVARARQLVATVHLGEEVASWQGNEK